MKLAINWEIVLVVIASKTDGTGNSSKFEMKELQPSVRTLSWAFKPHILRAWVAIVYFYPRSTQITKIHSIDKRTDNLNKQIIPSTAPSSKHSQSSKTPNTLWLCLQRKRNVEKKVEMVSEVTFISINSWEEMRNLKLSTANM